MTDWDFLFCRCALIVQLVIRLGPVWLLAFIYVLIVPAFIEIWVYTSVLSGTPIHSSPSPSPSHSSLTPSDTNRSTTLDSWQLSQLRTMKVGGNQSGKDFFNKNGGSALLNDSDTKKRYTSRVADMYKEELAKRVKEDTEKWVSTHYFISEVDLCVVL